MEYRSVALACFGLLNACVDGTPGVSNCRTVSETALNLEDSHGLLRGHTVADVLDWVNALEVDVEYADAEQTSASPLPTRDRLVFQVEPAGRASVVFEDFVRPNPPLALADACDVEGVVRVPVRMTVTAESGLLAEGRVVLRARGDSLAGVWVVDSLGVEPVGWFSERLEDPQCGGRAPEGRFAFTDSLDASLATPEGVLLGAEGDCSYVLVQWWAVEGQ